MSIQVTKDLVAYEMYNSTLNPVSYLSGYNTNIVKWTKDESETRNIVRGSVSITTENGEALLGYLYPRYNPSLERYEFSVDLYEIIKTYFGNFKDGVTYDISTPVIFDSTLFQTCTCVLGILYDDDTNDSTTLECVFLRSVKQHIDRNTGHFFNYPYGDFNVQNFLLNSNKEFLNINTLKFIDNIKIFKGYPLDISFIYPEGTISNVSYNLYDKVNAGSIQFDEIGSSLTPKSIGRMIISDGVNLLPILEDNPELLEGRLRFQVRDGGGFDKCVLGVNFTIVDECGWYVKWLNRQGGYSYWLFNKKDRQVMTTKTLGTIMKDAGLLSYETDEMSIGSSMEEKIQITSQDLEDWEFNHVLDLSTSPLVYLYTGEKGSPLDGDQTNWLRIPQINNFKFTKKSEQVKYTIGFELDLPRTFTQIL